MNALDRPSNASLFTEQDIPPAPAGHVWVEWVGEPSPLDSPVVQFNLITGKYTADQARVIRRLMAVRIARVHKHTRTIRRGNGAGQIPNLGVEFVRFGNDQRRRPGERGSFVQAVPFKAADAIKASECGHEFLIWNERDGEQQNAIAIQETGLKIETRDVFGDFGMFRREMGW